MELKNNEESSECLKVGAEGVCGKEENRELGGWGAYIGKGPFISFEQYTFIHLATNISCIERRRRNEQN